MNKVKILILLLSLTLLGSCKKNDFDTGIKATVVFGSGDCMPIVNESSRIYESYTGELYFIVKSDLDSLGSGDFSQLKANSIHKKVRHGKISAELPAGTYVIMLENAFSNDFVVTITQGIITEKELKFWQCTSW